MSDYISRESVLNTIEDMDKVLDIDRTVEEYKALLIECIKALPSRDSITELEKIKADLLKYNCHKCWRREETCKQKYHCESCKELAEIIDKHISELKGEQE